MVTGRGSFGHATVLGTTSSYWAPGEYATPIMGCPVAGQHVWGALRTGGRRALAIRHVMNESAVRLLAYDGGPGDDPRFVRHGGYAGLCELGEVEGQWGMVQPGDPPRLRFTTSRDAGRWIEHGLLDVRLTPVAEALQFATPDAEEPLAYLARMFTVDGGGYRDEPVTDGFVFHEQVYLRSGQGWALSRHKKHLQGVWLVFATRYADGGLHWGQICVGRDGWRFAIVISSGGPPLLVRDPEPVELVCDERGYPLRASFDLGAGEIWDWRPPDAGGGRIPLPGPPEATPRWAEGQVTRRGDERPVAFAHTWWESYPDRLNALVSPG